MEKKKKILMISGISAAVLVLILVVIGLVDGIWPWHGVKAYGKLFDPNGAPAPTEPVVTEPTEEIVPSGDENEGPDATVPTGDSLLSGENPDGSSKVKEEVEVGGNTGTGDNANSGESGTVSDADATVQGNQIPGWGN